MALVDYFDKCVMMDRLTRPDGMGGVVEDYQDGAAFFAGFSLDASTEAKIAYKNGVKEIFTIVIPKTIALKNGDVIKRLYDGVTFRITSNSMNMTTPEISEMKFSQVTAEVVQL